MFARSLLPCLLLALVCGGPLGAQEDPLDDPLDGPVVLLPNSAGERRVIERFFATGDLSGKTVVVPNATTFADRGATAPQRHP